MSKTFHSCAMALVILVGTSADVLGVHLRGEIVHVGFPGSSLDPNTQGADHYRLGCWTPVLVELANDDGDLFEGSIETRQKDRDGDEIIVKRDVVVRGTRRFYLYIPAGESQTQHPFIVRIFDADGNINPLYNDKNETITELLPTRTPTHIPNDARVILDISKRPVNQLAKLVESSDRGRDLIITRSSPADLPDDVCGLEMADIIIWDAADPSETDLPQREALIEWTRRGGKLVLGIGKNWEVIGKSAFADILPARLSGTSSTRNVKELGESLFGYADPDLNPPELKRSLTYCPVTLKTLTPDATSIIPSEPEGHRLFVTSRPCDRGEVIMVAAELQELLSLGTQPDFFLRRILNLRKADTESEDAFGFGATDLFIHIERMIGFLITAGIYLLFAFLFVIAYVAIATGGSWIWLKRKRMSQHTWLGFALVAVLASALSMAAVRLIRGIGHQVQQLTVVDGRAGSFDASATCYFGLKTASHVLLDLCVPSNWSNPDESPVAPGTLRPLPANNDRLSEDSVYATAQRYEAIAPLGQLRAVPFRATLKQFQGLWRGRMNGRLNASLLRESPTSPYLTQDSWIENDLNTNLDNCYLLVTSPTITPMGRARANQIYVYDIGKFGDKQKLTIQTLSAILEAKDDQEKPKPARQELDDVLEQKPTASKRWAPPQLDKMHGQWLRNLGAIGRGDFGYGDQRQLIKLDMDKYTSVLMLMSTYDDIDRVKFFSGKPGIERSQGQRLDVSSLLTEDTTLFVGFSREPGPVRICCRKPGSKTGSWKAIQPAQADVMYRVLIPINPE